MSNTRTFLIWVMSFLVTSAQAHNQSVAWPSLPSTLLVPKIDTSAKASNLTRSNILNQAILTMPSDFIEMGKYPMDHPWVTIGVVAATVGLIAVDKPTTSFLQRNFSSDWSPNRLWYTPTGASPEDGYLLLGLGGLYLGGNILDSPVNQVAALASFKSVAYSVIISQLVLKTVFGRIRPNPDLSDSSYINRYPGMYTNNPWDFFRKNQVFINTGSGPTSMPSYHFTEFFAVGTALSQAYDSYWPYLITAAGLLPNFEGHHHWTSDMFAGAAIGTLIGYVVTNNLKNKLGLNNSQNLTIEPDLANHAVSIKYTANFG